MTKVAKCLTDVTVFVEKLFKTNTSAKTKKTVADKETAIKKAQKATTTEKAQKAAAAKTDKKETSKADPEGWTIVEPKSKSIKDRHATPEKRTPEKRKSHILIKYNQRKETMVIHPDTKVQTTITND
jgi:hypothetical protein